MHRGWGRRGGTRQINWFRIILAITKEFAKEEVDKETHLTLPKSKGFNGNEKRK
jgi:hypothetical protein